MTNTTTESPTSSRVIPCAGADAQDLLDSLACWLEAHADQLNALNVFPVPDGDTGINMSRTMRAAAEAAAAAAGDAAAVFKAASHGALLGAAGNSGVILSQMIRGFAEVYSADEVVDGNGLRSAFEAASAAGYRSVAQPVEGTILSVARETANSIQHGSPLIQALADALQAATAAVEATPSQLEKLRVAGVVDAGGEGLRLIIEGAYRWLSGENLRSISPMPAASRALVGSQHTDSQTGFCTQLMIEHSSLSVDELKAQLAPLCTSVMVVGAEDLIRLHVHAVLPGLVLDLAVGAGVVSRVSIENMELQNQAAREETRGWQTGIVVVAQSETAARLLGSLGAAYVVVPAATSPTVQELLSAVQRLGHEHILILPNDKNSVLAAEQLRALTSRAIHIIPTENVVQCMQCLLAFNPDMELSSQKGRLLTALRAAAIVELARANRAADLPAAQVRVGSVVAIQDGQIVASADSATDALSRAVASSDAVSVELATLYPCADLDRAELPELEAQLRSLYPSAEHETVPLDLPARLALIALE